MKGKNMENRALYRVVKTVDDIPRPPQGLRARGKRLWLRVVEHYELEDWMFDTLYEACRSLDTIDAAEKDIRKYGVTIAGRYGRKSNPATITATQNRTVYARLMRELGLDAIDAEAARPKPLYGGRRK